MLSRSPSTATNSNNPRQFKSIHTIQNRSSFGCLADQTALKQHALVAATVAYERAHGKEISQPYQQSPQLSRKRSSRATRFEGEGSHFKDYQTPNRRFSKRQFNAANIQLDHARPMRGTLSSDVSNIDYVDESGIPGAISRVVGSADDERFKQHRSSISVHKLRKAKSMYTTTDPVHSTCIEDISFGGPPPISPLIPQPLEEMSTRLSELDVEKSVDNIATTFLPLTRTHLENINPRPPAIAMDATEVVNSQKMRHRASFMLTSFKRRRDNEDRTCTTSALRVLRETQHANPVHPPELRTPTASWRKLRKPSSDGTTLNAMKSRIQAIFRKSSSSHTELPVQQVNARRAYFGNGSIGDPASAHDAPGYACSQPNSTSYSQKLLQPPLCHGYELPRGISPGLSEQTHTSKSRVTSWADSTIAGTVLEVTEDLHLSAIEEESQRTSNLVHRQERHSSLNLFNRKQRKSRNDLQGSEDDTTNHKFESGRPTSRALSRISASSRKASSALETLPSQFKKFATLTKSSTREVKSRDASDHIDDVSKSIAAIDSMKEKSHAHEKQNHNSSIQFRRKPLPSSIDASSPGIERLETRLLRSKERWQEPLDTGRSLFFPRSARDSPDRLSVSDSISDGSQGDSQSGVPHVPSTPTDGHKHNRSVDATSPSIYSQDDACHNLDDIFTTMPQTLTQDCLGTAVISTDQPVLRYPVGSPRNSQSAEPRKLSKDWKKWLQCEVQELETSNGSLDLSPCYVEHDKNKGHHREETQIYDDDDDEARSSDGDSDDGRRATRGVNPSKTYASTMSTETPQKSIETKHATMQGIQGMGGQSLCAISMPCESTPGFDLPSAKPRGASRGRPTASQSHVEVRSSSYCRTNDSPAYTSRPSSRMNDRFPYFENSRPQSRASRTHSRVSRPQSRGSRRSITPAQSMHSRGSRPTVLTRKQSYGDKENITPTAIDSLPARFDFSHQVVRRPMSSAALGRSRSTFTNYTTNNISSSPVTPDLMLARRPPTLIPRPVTDSPHIPHHNFEVASATVAHARQGAVNSYMVFENDPTLVSIMQGPYHENASPRPLSIRKVTVCSRENSPMKENSAPAVPSQRRMCTPTGGQRLVEQFLHARRFRDDIKVMSPDRGSPNELSPAFL